MLKDTEQWKDIKGSPYHQVSNMGRIWNAKYERYLYGSCDKNGNMLVRISTKDGSKLERIHRLVALAFLDNPDNYPVVRHKDNNKKNNRVDNLVWCKPSYSHESNHRKETKCIELDTAYLSSEHAAYALNIDSSSIRKCCRGERKTAGGYHWEYCNGEY